MPRSYMLIFIVTLLLITISPSITTYPRYYNSGEPLYLAIIWHQHQPFYEDLYGNALMPWPRLHDSITRSKAIVYGVGYEYLVNETQASPITESIISPSTMPTTSLKTNYTRPLAEAEELDPIHMILILSIVVLLLIIYMRIRRRFLLSKRYLFISYNILFKIA